MACVKLEEYQTAKAALEVGATLAPGDSRFTNLIKECTERIAEEEAEGLLKESTDTTVKIEADTTPKDPKPVTSSSTYQTTAPVTKPKYRHEFYQKPEEVVVTVFAKGIPKNNVKVDFGEQILSVTIDVPGEDPFVFQPRLFGKIVPSKCRFEILSTKVEIRVAKAEPIQWTSLEFNRENAVVTRVNVPSEMLFDRNKDYEFISQVYELDPGEIYEIITYLFEFSGVEMPHDTYHGVKVNLRSLKLGLVPGQTSLSGLPQAFVFSLGNSSDASGLSWIDKRSRQGKESSILTRSCLACLSANGGTSGAFLRRLHLHNIERMDSMALGAALSSCPSLLDFEIAGLHVELRQTLESISKCCPLIERLSFESSKTGRDDSLKLQTCNELVNGCPNLSYLSLRGFRLLDYKTRVLVKGFRNLKFVDFSTSYSITGAFLKNLGGNVGGDCIEVLMLRDCIHLKQVEVSRLFSSLLVGDFKHLRLLDISNREGLASDDDWCRRCFSTSFIPEQLVEKRPLLRLLAEFSVEGSYMEVSNDHNSDDSSTQLLTSSSSHTSDGSMIASFSESYDSLELTSSSNSSGDSDDVVYAVYGESSDELGSSSG